MFNTNGEFDRLRSNYQFIKIDSIRMKITTQLGYTSKVLAAPPTFHTIYLSNSTPYTASSIAQLDHAVKHDSYGNGSTEVIFNLPEVLEYHPDMIIGTSYWTSLRNFPNYLYFYAGFGYFDPPSLDVVSATALPIFNVEISLRTRFACPILAT